MMIKTTTFMIASSMSCWMWMTRRMAVVAFQSTVMLPRRTAISTATSTTRWLSSSSSSSSSNADGEAIDSLGRKIRRRSGGWEDENENDNNDDNDDWMNAPASTTTRTNTNTNTNTNRRDSGGWKDNNDGDDGDDWGAPSQNTKGSRSSSSSGGGSGSSGGWEDFDPWDDQDTPTTKQRQSPPQRKSRQNNNYRGGEWRNDNNNNGPRGGGGGRRRGGGGDWGRNNNDASSFGRGGNREGGGGRRNNKVDKSRSINMNALEGAGFVHLYGLSSILNALKSERRDLTTVQEKSAMVFDNDDEETIAEEEESREPPKPQAQFRPYLFVQERKTFTGRRGQKADDAEQVLQLAEEHNVPIAEVDKGILNTLSGNRPHQGFVLRCGKLYFESLSRLPVSSDDTDAPSLWLALDEVVDPQNLGALLRSAYFLGHEKMGVLVCSKNSAPPTPVVSAASAGALEVLTVHSTNNLPRTLSQAKDDGFRIIGASSSVPSSSRAGVDGDSDEDAPSLYNLQDLPPSHDDDGDDAPVVLVLGSEGYGLRTLVAKACTEFVKIPTGAESNDAVDSLNVSVTGGILLWHLLNGGGAKRR